MSNRLVLLRSSCLLAVLVALLVVLWLVVGWVVAVIVAASFLFGAAVLGNTHRRNHYVGFPQADDPLEVPEEQH